MKPDPTLRERIEKLPAWAQAHIKDLVRQREAAVATLQRFEDEQTKAPFYTDELVCETKGSPQYRRRYVHAHRMMFEHRGLDIAIGMYDTHVSIQYGQRGGLKDIMFQPTSYQSFALKYPEQES